jgi:integrase
MRLTDAAVAALKMPAGKTEHFWWDESLPAFGIRARQETEQAPLSLRWYVQYRAGGRQRRESLGDVRKITLDAARKIARQRFAMVELGEDPAAKREQAKAAAAAQKLKLGLVADRYLAIKRGTLRPRSYQATERYLRNHWKGLRAEPISAVKRVDVAAILQEITVAHGRVSAARARSNLSALFGWAMREGLCDANPVIATNDPGRGLPTRERILSDSEVKVIWESLLDDSFGKIIKLLLLCGCRREEIGALRWSEIDSISGALIIPGERTKGGKALTLTLAPLALEILRSVPRRDGQEFVFGKAGRAGFNAWSYCTIALNNRIAAAATGRPLPHWTIHDLRRTMRSGLGRLGIAPHIAELVIGHAQTGVQAIYDRYRYDAEIKAALAVWADHVIAIVEGRVAQVVPLRA